MCNQSGAGMGQYGSSSGYRPTGMNTTAYQSNPMPQNNNPILQNAQQYGQFRMGQMPSYPSRYNPQVPNVQPPWTPNQGGPMAPPGYGGGYTQPDGTQVLPSPAPQAPSASSYAPAIGSPPSAFGIKPGQAPGFAPPMGDDIRRPTFGGGGGEGGALFGSIYDNGTRPSWETMQQPAGPQNWGTRPGSVSAPIQNQSFSGGPQQPPEMTSGLHPYQPSMQPMPSSMPSYQAPQDAPAQNALVAQSNANLFSNPWGFSQQQLGPSFNPMGSAQGGYFQGNQYVPNVGNARNGLDDLARWGVNWNGVQNGRPGVY